MHNEKMLIIKYSKFILFFDLVIYKINSILKVKNNLKNIKELIQCSKLVNDIYISIEYLTKCIMPLLIPTFTSKRGFSIKE